VLASVSLFQNNDWAGDCFAAPLKGQVAIHAIVRKLSRRLGEVVLDFVHPEAIAIIEGDPSRLEANVDHDELHCVLPQQISNVRRRQSANAGSGERSLIGPEAAKRELGDDF